MSPYHICKARCEIYNGTVAYKVLLRLFLQGFKGHYVQYLLVCGGESGDKAILLMYVTYSTIQTIVAMSMQHYNYYMYITNLY